MPKNSSLDSEASGKSVVISSRLGPLALSGVSQTSDEGHQGRLQDLRGRQHEFEQASKGMAINIVFPETLTVTHVASLAALSQEHSLEILRPEDYTTATQCNLPGFSTLYLVANQKGKSSSTSSTSRGHFYGHLLKFKTLSAEWRAQLIESLKILRHFCRPTSCRSFVHIFDIFYLSEEQQVFVTMEQFSLELTLQHRMWSQAFEGYLKVSTVKCWAIQLAEAIEMLNVAGVANRFIRPETIVLSSSRNENSAVPRITSFDFACLYWDPWANAPKAIHPRALPLEKPAHLLDHLSPECFLSGYDASNVDVWSLGALISLLLTGSTPFEIPDMTQDRQPEHEAAWIRSEERRIVPEEIRSLLDDIFKNSNQRMTAQEIAKDFRLTCKETKEFLKKKMAPYYRINITKNLNVERPALSTAPRPVPKKVSPSTYSEKSVAIFKSNPHYRMRKGMEADVKAYRVLRDISFEGDNTEGQFLKARQIESNSACLAKIVQKRCIPNSQRNLLLNESCKILRFFSDFEPVKGKIHRLLSCYLCEEGTVREKVILFFESLTDYKSIHQLVQERLKKESFPPPARGSVNLTLANIQVWMRELTQIAEYLSQHGTAHRYIRGEFVYVDETNPELIKLSHFDMACFLWNPLDTIWVPRTQGLQDKMEHLWDHLPADCFEPLYDGGRVDLWSIGVLLAYCLTGAKPFRVPMSTAETADQWISFKESHATVFKRLAPVLELLDNIFATFDKRLCLSDVLVKLAPENLRMGRLSRTATPVRRQRPISGKSSANIKVKKPRSRQQ